MFYKQPTGKQLLTANALERKNKCSLVTKHLSLEDMEINDDI